MSRLRPVWIAVIGVHVGLLLYAGRVHAPNYLEANLLPAGYLHVKYGRFDNAQVSTPLSRMAAAVPLLFFDVNEDWGSLINEGGFRPEYPVGADFIRNNVGSLRGMFFAGRAVLALFSVLGAACVYSIARRLYGARAALAAVVVWCCCPMVLGHGATMNHDVPGAAMLALAFLFVLRLWDDAGVLDGLACGVVCGLAFLTRTTNIAFIGLWLLWFVLLPGRDGSESGAAGRLKAGPQRGAAAGLVLGVALLVLNVGYEFSGSMTRLGEFEFVSEALGGAESGTGPGNRFRGTLLEHAPVPLPSDFVRGVDLQQKDFESPRFKSYLRGEWRERGWWYYCGFAWLVKTPIGFQLALLVGLAVCVVQWFRGRSRPHECLVVASIALMFVMASVKSGFTIHYRYVLPAFPFIAVLTGGTWRDGLRRPVVQAASAVMVACGALSSLSAFPHSLSYFHEFVGGPRNGGRYLLHSSNDWGQDLYKLAEWFEKRRDGPGGPVFLEVHGAIKPHLLGLPHEPMPRRSGGLRRGEREREIRPGVYVISISLLYAENSAFRYLDALEPCGHAGYSIKIYDLTREEIDARGWNERAR